MLTFLKKVRPWAELLLAFLGFIGIFITWWVLLITWDTAENIGVVWTTWLRSIFLGIPFIVLANVLLWRGVKGKVVWVLSFIGAPIFATFLTGIWWLFEWLLSVWNYIMDFFRDAINFI